MQHVISNIQKDGVVWLQDNVIRTYRPSSTDFVHALHKVFTYYFIYYYNYFYIIFNLHSLCLMGGIYS